MFQGLGFFCVLKSEAISPSNLGCCQTKRLWYSKPSISYYWKCYFPMNPHGRSSVAVGLSVCTNFEMAGKITLPCSYRSNLTSKCKAGARTIYSLILKGIKFRFTCISRGLWLKNAYLSSFKPLNSKDLYYLCISILTFNSLCWVCDTKKSFAYPFLRF